MCGGTQYQLQLIVVLLQSGGSQVVQTRVVARKRGPGLDRIQKSRYAAIDLFISGGHFLPEYNDVDVEIDEPSLKSSLMVALMKYLRNMLLISSSVILLSYFKVW